MWIVHIDTWNYPDPQKIIDLIPEDIRPFVAMNISLSISHDSSSRFQVAEYGYEIAKSWMRVCAQNRMWAIIQHSSGGYAQFSDHDLSVYEEFYREYPNLIGFSYAEQFWGYGEDDPLSPSWTDRIDHFTNLLELTNKYGGYLVVSWCGNQWSPPINPIAMLKRNPDFAAACRKYTENYLLFEKYTQQSYISDMESICLGAYLSGYSGQYGIRYDPTGWSDAAGANENFTLATGGAAHLEHMMLTGQTMVDGPELIWTECFREISEGPTTGGYTMRRWDTFPQFDNVSVDLFRKVLDGTVRIPSREEVIERTKFVIINDVDAGSIDDIYSSPGTLFEGLYRMDGDGNLRNNKSFFKKTGRYPTVPTVFALDDELAQSFAFQVKSSEYATRWPTIQSKVSEFDAQFPSEYTGDLYAGRHENGWIIYNPFKTGQTASGSIPFKYNTAERMELTFSQYTSSVIKEFADKLTVYLSNYDENSPALKTNTIKIYGSSAEPTFAYTERGEHPESFVTKDWSSGVFTLTIQHNGPLDLTINCSGSASDRLTSFTPASIEAPARPMVYTGPLQLEGECFDYKSIASIVKGGYAQSARNYSGQGYLRFGTNASAATRDTVTVQKSGTYRLETKYAVTGGSVGSIELFVNGAKVAAPNFAATSSYSDWAVDTQTVSLNAGENTIEFRASASATQSVYFDNIVIVPTSYGDGAIVQESDSGFTSVDGSIKSEHTGYTGTGYADSDDASGAGVDWALEFDSSVTKAFTFRYASTSEATANLLVNGQLLVSEIQFPATGLANDWDYVTAYASVPVGSANVRLEAVSSAGLPNIDRMEVVGGTPWLAGMAPFTPLELAANAVSTSQINLTWSATPGAETYIIKRATSASGPYTPVATGIANTSFSDTDLDELTTYFYAIKAANANGESSDSAPANATTLSSQTPPPPTNFSGVATYFDSARMTWSAVLGADSYNIKRSLYSGGPYTKVASNITDTAFNDSDLLAGANYYYVISANNNNGEGANSAQITLTPPTVVTLEPAADTYARDGGSANANFGSDIGIVVKYDGNIGSGFNRYTYLKFDVAGLDDAESMKLIMVPFQVDGNATLAYSLVTDDSWAETGVTWNNQPTAAATPFATRSGFAVGQPIETDLTTVAKAESESDGVLSIQISQPTTQAIFVGFNSRETVNADLRPVLQVTMPKAVTPSPPISPSEWILSDATIAADGTLSLSIGNSVLGHRYTLLATDDLANPDWQLVGDRLLGDGSTITISIHLEDIARSRFFKLDVDRL